jgi:hypothetical protein
MSPPSTMAAVERGFQVNNPRLEQMPEVPEELLDEIAAGGNGPGSNAVTPPDPFVRTPKTRSDP